MDDPRFKPFLKDLRNQKIPKNGQQVKVDKKFQNMFSSKQFKGSCQIDERGRQLNLDSSGGLKKFYDLTDSSSSEDEEESTTEVSHPMAGKEKELKKMHDDQESENSDEDSTDEKGSEVGEDEKETNTPEEEESESSDSDSDDSISEKKYEIEHRWEELHEEAPDTDEISRRIAVCNMDWDRIRADDLFVAFNSFKPADSIIHSVKIYPSEFGQKRMEEEKLKGPKELVEKNLDPDEEEPLNKKESDYNREKLRQYQMNRLKYYYAVVECDTPETANTLYEQLNGMEYESSAVRFDLRFIPDDVTFDQEPSSVSEKIPDPTEYKPNLFVTTALQQGKVDLTWDETDPWRQKTMQKAFTEPEAIEDHLKNYLASSSGESEIESDDPESAVDGKLSTKDRIAKYRELLQSLEDKDDKDKKEDEKYEMEITWDPDLKAKTKTMVKQKLEDTGNPFDEMLRKKKENRKLKKQNKKSEAQMGDDKDNSESGDSDSEAIKKNLKEQDEKRIDELYLISDSKKIVEEPSSKYSKKKKKSKKIQESNEFQCNVLDPRFSAVYSSHEYNIDPSDPHFKKTEGSMAIIKEKQKRLKNKAFPVDEKRENKKMKYH